MRGETRPFCFKMSPLYFSRLYYKLQSWIAAVSGPPAASG
ncbi:hypothetical protein CLOSTASPAR_05980 [[Clostridium] asparagiforme DSM 15981]|uniref:Uncharacterized protein n=1 Tax=[Clostridium] asparagiforme DSM 15981 TaxID=518636 RepID=C0D9N0_9FIRM|nr:hypothetical protein CLOSTASPAR_05980 [[Clostridium] asparagiforme DSM 15981]